MATKICPSCNEEKSLSEFYKRYRGHQRDCVDCRRAYNRKYYQQRKRMPLAELKSLLERIETHPESVTGSISLLILRERIQELETELGLAENQHS